MLLPFNRLSDLLKGNQGRSTLEVAIHAYTSNVTQRALIQFQDQS